MRYLGIDMKRSGRQSDNIEDIRDPKANEKYQQVENQRRKAMNSPRMLSDDSVAYNQDKSPSDYVASAMKNPGRSTMSRTTGMNRTNHIKDPSPEFLDTTYRSNYDEVPFFKHKEVPNVYKEEK